ncbi:hypothetical protein Cabys_1558 [Caldithrix abyssi DSM 13497]|uniref:Uncharacterized protein n=1 Tax=Caldithrix abyssi DSM 13497 TaxID=880073 RepID=A0A1J1C6I9_CALAY|nr:hypothetical protein Cabys_1558 [Caldithrix abyssi DSM 13497]
MLNFKAKFCKRKKQIMEILKSSKSWFKIYRPVNPHFSLVRGKV